MNRVRRRLVAAAAAVPLMRWARAAPAFDHEHAAWTALLRKHVHVVRSGQASQVRYAGFAADRQRLGAYLSALSAVAREDFDAFTQAQRQAFLINAYNAFTIELVLTRYPDLRSIRDLGTVFQNPWKPKWIALLGSAVSLDDIEHGMLRKRGAYDDPRIHFAVNCASIGCPPLREEAFVAGRLDAQLAEQSLRFMSDRNRNRWNAERERLELSRIFDWYGEDFRLGHRGVTSVEAFAARYADRLADLPAVQDAIRSATVKIGFTEYDWALNDVRGAA